MRHRLLLLLAATAAAPAWAHAQRSAYVEVVEQSPGQALVSQRALVPVSGVRLSAEAPCRLETPAIGPGVLRCPGTVAGARLQLDGLGVVVSEAVVWVHLAGGASSSMLVTAGQPTFTLPGAGVGWPQVARQYVGLGVKHILLGFDHLLFLLGLVVVLRRARSVLLAETAFTLSHSLSFSASALGWVHVPVGPVEACIALSLVLVALDAARAKGRPGPVAQGAALAFVFGLVHGLGFAGGLAEVGLPERAIPAALVGFAGGVEVGQVAFLALLLGLFWAAARGAAGAASLRSRLLAGAATYAVGSVGFFLLIQRFSALFPPAS